MRALAFAFVLMGSLVAGCVSDDPSPIQQAPLPPAITAPVPDVAEIRQLHAQVEAAVAEGASVAIPAGKVAGLFAGEGTVGQMAPVEVLLTESTIFTNTTWAEVDGQVVALPFVAAYEGHVVGDEASLVRLTIADGWARGSIRQEDSVALVRIGFEGNVPSNAPESAARMTMPRLPVPKTFDGPEYVEGDCLELVPPYVQPVLPVVAEPSLLVAEVILDADADYLEQTGAQAFPMMVAMFQEMESIYHDQVGIRMHIAGLHLNTEEGYYPDPGDRAPLEKLAGYWNDRHTDRDLVHLFTGIESSYAQANCIGGAGIPDKAYAFTPYGWERDYTVFHTNAFAHEFGHLFSAHHHYGNHVETEAQGATIMIQGYTPGFRPVFGSLEKATIRGWAEEYLEPLAG